MGKISTLLDVDIWIYVWIWINRDIFKTNANVLYWYEVFHSKGEEKRKKKKNTNRIQKKCTLLDIWLYAKTFKNMVLSIT